MNQEDTSSKGEEGKETGQDEEGGWIKGDPGEGEEAMGWVKGKIER